MSTDMMARATSKRWQTDTDRRNLMAKAKKKKEEPIEEIKAEEVVVNSVEKSQADVETFIMRQLMAINKMPDRAKAQRLAERVLRNRKG